MNPEVPATEVTEPRQSMGKRESRRKDRWDKAEIVLGAFIPASIALVGVLITASSGSLQDSFERTRSEAANTQAQVARATFLMDFRQALTSPDASDSEKEVALEALSAALGEDAKPILAVIASDEAVSDEPSQVDQAARAILARRELKREGSIFHAAVEHAKYESACIDAPDGYELLPYSISISPAANAGPRAWGAELESLQPTKACYRIWLSRIDGDVKRVNWRINATAVPAQSNP